MLFNMLVTVACCMFAISTLVVNIAIVTHDMRFVVALQLFAMLSATNSETTLDESLAFFVLGSSSATRQTTPAFSTAVVNRERICRLQHNNQRHLCWETMWVWVRSGTRTKTRLQITKKKRNIEDMTRELHSLASHEQLPHEMASGTAQLHGTLLNECVFPQKAECDVFARS